MGGRGDGSDKHGAGLTAWGARPGLILGPPSRGEAKEAVLAHSEVGKEESATDHSRGHRARAAWADVVGSGKKKKKNLIFPCL